MKTYVIDITEDDGDVNTLLIRLESSDLAIIVANLQIVAQKIGPKSYQDFLDKVRSLGQQPSVEVLRFLKGMMDAADRANEDPGAAPGGRREPKSDVPKPPEKHDFSRSPDGTYSLKAEDIGSEFKIPQSPL
jgi:hypothetical protein